MSSWGKKTTIQNQTRLTFNILNDNYPGLAVEPENSTLVLVVTIKTNAETEILSLNQAALYSAQTGSNS